MNRFMNPNLLGQPAQSFQQVSPLQALLGGVQEPMPQQQVMVPSMNPQQNRSSGGRQLIADLMMGIGAGLASGNPGASAAVFQQQLSDGRERKQRDASRNATLQWMRGQAAKNPLMGELIGLVEADVLTPGDAFKMAMQKPDMPSSVQEYEYARQNGFQGSFQEWLAAKQNQAGPETLGLNAIMAVGPDGKPMMFQLGNRGSIRQMEFPEGVTPLSPYDTSLQKSLGAETGKAKAGALSQMPAARAKVEAIEAQVDALLNHPKFRAMVGPFDAMRPNISGGARDWQSRFDQLTGQAFLAARQELKGGGAITDFEGQKAEMALNRANQATDEASFREAMLEFKEAIRRGYEILAEQAASVPGNIAPANPGKVYRYNPQTGQLE